VESLDNNNNVMDTIAAARCRARLSFQPISLQRLPRCVVRQSLRVMVGLIAFGWLLLGIVPAVTSTGISWQLPQAIAGSVLYVNDAAGRLAAVIDPTSNAAVYHYDAVGNILSINQYPATQVSIITVNPNNSTGSQAQVCGTGFSSTLSQNTVSFNGVTSTILSVSGACLIVAVPANATTGPVTLTTPSGSATSGAPYVIPPAPTISGFTPTIGDPGTIVTVSGSTLNPIAGATKVALGNTNVALTSITSSQLSFSIPSNIGSGPIQVVTPYGKATSALDFIVPPPAIGAANVVSSAMLMVNGGAKSLNINASNKYGIFVFNATAGQLLSLQLTSLTTTPSGGTVNYQVYSPANVQIASGTVSAASNMSIHLPAVPTTGTYLVAFNSGSGTAQLSTTLETASSLMANGATLSTVTTTAAQSKRFSFTATAGQNLALYLIGLTLTPTTVNYAYAYVYKPDGSYFASTTCYTTDNGCAVSLINLPQISLPQTGTYSVVVQAGGAATMNFKASLSSPVTGTLGLNGASTSLNLTLPGQGAQATFSGTAGQSIDIAVVANVGGSVTVFGPDGSAMGRYAPYFSVLPFVLPTTGTYTVLFQQTDLTTGSLTLTLSSPVTGTLNVNGASPTLNLIHPGQGGQLTFSGVAGQHLNLTVVADASMSAQVYVVYPDGFRTLGYDFLRQGSGSVSLNLPPLLLGGTYTVFFHQGSATTGPVSFTLSSPVVGTFDANGTSSLTVLRLGQGVQATFNGTAGQHLNVRVVGFTTMYNYSMYGYATVFGPNGSTLASTFINFDYDLVVLPTLPLTGTYTVLFEQLNTSTGTVTLSMISTQDGDLNADGVVDVADVALAERIAIGLVTPTANQLLHGDVAPAGGNGTIDIADVARIRRKALGLENF